MMALSATPLVLPTVVPRTLKMNRSLLAAPPRPGSRPHAAANTRRHFNPLPSKDLLLPTREPRAPHYTAQPGGIDFFVQTSYAKLRGLGNFRGAVI